MAADPVLLMAPLTGVMVPIEEVPDPVFAQKMVGDGFSIFPMTDVLRSPVDGEVVHVHDAKHAITVRSGEGLEVLMHIGLDTVSMGGEGFDVRVSAGQQVKAGDALIVFDLAAVRERAESVLTQVVVANGELVDRIETMNGVVAEGVDVTASVYLAAAPAASSGAAAPVSAPSGSTAVGAAGEGGAGGASAGGAGDDGQAVEGDEIVIPNPTGLHARPAATLAGIAKEFSSAVQLRSGERSADAKSIIAIMALGLAHHAPVRVVATGPDAQAAVDRVTSEIRGGLGEDVEQAPAGGPDTTAMPALEIPQAAEAEHSAPAARRSEDPDVYLGVSASPGLGVGTIVHLRDEAAEFEETAADPQAELTRLDTALEQGRGELADLQLKLADDPEKAAIFGAHTELLDDPSLRESATRGIEGGASAPAAWREAFNQVADQFAALDNEVLAGRAVDVRDVGRRVLRLLTGAEATGMSGGMDLPDRTILVAEDLAPSDTAQMDPSKVAGFATVFGGASSHVAIIARSLGIPAVAGIEAATLDVADGTLAVLDGGAGSLRVNVTEDEVTRVAERQQRMATQREADLARAFDPAVTSDGHHIEVVANIGGAEDARHAVTMGAEGVGLLRSEFVFMGRSTAPTEDEQTEIYREIAGALGDGQPLVIRTLDVGGDKPLPYLPIPHEENPFLGIRGVRVGLEQPEVLRTQVRAILRAADAGAKLQVMFPMIATLEDFRSAKAIFDEEAASLGVTGVPLGIMVEVPSVAVMARQFAREADFFSVGTNDLTSYTLAMDRGHPKLAPQVDPCNPAVLQLIGQAALAAHDNGKWLGICGGIASDVQAVPFLIGLGVNELSCSIPAIPEIKAAVRSYSFEECRELARRALDCSTAAEVRALNPLPEA